LKLSCLASFTSSMVLIPVFCYIKRPKQISFTWPAVLKYLRPAAQRFLLFVFFEVRASRIHPIVHFPRNWISPLRHASRAGASHHFPIPFFMHASDTFACGVLSQVQPRCISLSLSLLGKQSRAAGCIGKREVGAFLRPNLCSITFPNYHIIILLC